ncbi:hypothetical protein TTHERM_00647510 (macronuclear) [Tetrahymena thermophila SB210]|uniref:Uncharacterized protein n=1 Tax=Tetrahymena thermophila (strain SB210) TaxID=312017 RepID=I7MJU9_TETTS|nr:hypothetical protein TTHERM_00647510 [Tetrahymena thermophila SB210]EAS07218.1 hypothetical protein TTHERM_00647510 [Tetrahymena thermophila SB210]|eukprot:XP_001027460.1 hypothetical protein TTHERM_00647510 [Tetrahymena thermophila SB210]
MNQAYQYSQQQNSAQIIGSKNQKKNFPNTVKKQQQLQEEYDEILYSENAIQSKRKLKKLIQQNSGNINIVDDVRDINKAKEQVTSGFFPSFASFIQKIKCFSLKDNIVNYLKNKQAERQILEQEINNLDINAGKQAQKNEMVAEINQEQKKSNQINNQETPRKQNLNQPKSSRQSSQSVISNSNLQQQQQQLNYKKTQNNVVIHYNTYNIQKEQNNSQKNVQQFNQQRQPNQDQQYQIQYSQNSSSSKQSKQIYQTNQYQQNYINQQPQYYQSANQVQNLNATAIQRHMPEDVMNQSENSVLNGFKYNINHQSSRIPSSNIGNHSSFNARYTYQGSSYTKQNILQKIIVFYDNKYIKDQQNKKKLQNKNLQQTNQTMTQEDQKVKVLKPIAINPYNLRPYSSVVKKESKIIDIERRVKEQAQMQVERLQNQERYNNRVNWSLAENTRAAQMNNFKLTENEEDRYKKQKILKDLHKKMKEKQRYMLNEDDDEDEEDHKSNEIEEYDQILDSQLQDQDSNMIYSVDSNKPQRHIIAKKNQQGNQANANKKSSSSNDEFQTSCSSDDDGKNKINGLHKKGARQGPSSLYRSPVPFIGELKEDFQNMMLKMTESQEIFDLFVQFLKKIQSSEGAINISEKQQQEIKQQILQQLQQKDEKLNGSIDFSEVIKNKETILASNKKKLSPIQEKSNNSENKNFSIDQIFNNSASKQDDLLQFNQKQAQETVFQINGSQNKNQAQPVSGVSSSENTLHNQNPNQIQIASEINNNLFQKNQANNIFSTINPSNQSNSGINLTANKEVSKVEVKQIASDVASNIFGNQDKNQSQTEEKSEEKKSVLGPNIFQRIDNPPNNSTSGSEEKSQLNNQNQEKSQKQPAVQPLNLFANSGVNLFSASKASQKDEKTEQQKQSDKVEEQTEQDQLKKDNEILKSQLDIRRSESLTSKQAQSNNNQQEITQQPTTQNATITNNLVESQVLQQDSKKKIIPLKISDSKKKDQQNAPGQNEANNDQKTNQTNTPSINLFAPNNQAQGVNIFAPKTDSKSKENAQQNQQTDSKQKSLFSQNAENLFNKNTTQTQQDLDKKTNIQSNDSSGNQNKKTNSPPNKTTNPFQQATQNPFQQTTQNPFSQPSNNPFAGSSQQNNSNNQAPKPLSLESLVSQNKNMFSNQQQTATNQTANNLFSQQNNIFGNVQQQNTTNNNTNTVSNNANPFSAKSTPTSNSWLNNQNTNNTLNNNNPWNQNNTQQQNLFQNNQNNNLFNQPSNQNVFNASQNKTDVFANNQNGNNIFNTNTNVNNNNPFLQSNQTNQNNQNNANSILNQSFGNGSNNMIIDNNQNSNWQNQNAFNNSNNGKPWNQQNNSSNNYNFDSMGIENPMNQSMSLGNNGFNTSFGNNNGNNYFSQSNNYNQINPINNQQFYESRQTNYLSQNAGASTLFSKPSTPLNVKPVVNTPAPNNNVNVQSQLNDSQGQSSIFFDNQNKTKGNRKTEQATRVSKLLGHNQNSKRI